MSPVSTLLIGWLAIAAPFGQPENPPGPAPAASSFDQRLSQLDARMAEVRDVRARFEQSKSTPLLKRPMVSKGRLVGRETSVLWETLEPRRSSMLVSAEAVNVLYPADRILETYPIKDRARDAAVGPIPRLAALKQHFVVSPLDPASLDPKAPASFIGLLLMPRDEDLKRHIQSVKVLIDDRVPCANRIVITDPDGEETVMVFSAVEVNSGVKDSDLELKVPEGTRVTTPGASPEGK